MRAVIGLLISSLSISCSSTHQGYTPIVQAHDYQLHRTLSDTCGEISTESSTREFRYLSEKLVNATNRVTPLRYPLKLKFVACSEPLAFSLGAGSIIFSQGLVKKLPLEAQLAFVIAHELGHEALGHHQQMTGGDDSDSPSVRARRLEQEADHYALKILILAGYDPQASVTTIEALMNTKQSDLAHGGYPSLSSRRKTLQHLIFASQWQGPGILNRRDYTKLRQELQQAHDLEF